MRWVDGLPAVHERQQNSDFILAADALARGTVSSVRYPKRVRSAEILIKTTVMPPFFSSKGEEIVGAKQNRFVATSVSLKPNHCHHAGTLCANGAVGGSTHHPLPLGVSARRHCGSFLKERTRRGRIAARYGPEQVAIWKEIERRHQALGIPFQSGRLSQVLETHRSQVEDLRANIRCVEGASGIAVANNGLAVSVDIFGDPSICQQVWLVYRRRGTGRPGLARGGSSDDRPKHFRSAVSVAASRLAAGPQTIGLGEHIVPEPTTGRSPPPWSLMAALFMQAFHFQ